MVSQADAGLPVPELDQKSISHFLFSTGKTVKVHSVLWNGDMVGWGGEGRSAPGEARDLTMQAVEERGEWGFWGNFSMRNPSDALPGPGRRKQVSSFPELSHGPMCLKKALNQLCVLVGNLFICKISTLLTTAGLPKRARNI